MQIKAYILHEKHFIFCNIKMHLYGIKEIYSIIIAHNKIWNKDWNKNWPLAISVILNKFPCKYLLEQISFEWNNLNIKTLIMYMISFSFFYSYLEVTWNSSKYQSIYLSAIQKKFISKCRAVSCDGFAEWALPVLLGPVVHAQPSHRTGNGQQLGKNRYQVRTENHSTRFYFLSLQKGNVNTVVLGGKLVFSGRGMNAPRAPGRWFSHLDEWENVLSGFCCERKQQVSS